jgi:hypothetical protein
MLYSRTYSNVLNILGNLNGLFKFLFLISSFLLYPLHNLILKMSLLFHIFDVFNLLKIEEKGIWVQIIILFFRIEFSLFLWVI